MDPRYSPSSASDGHSASDSDASRSKRTDDSELLDAYSRAVTTVVSETIPSVISVTGTERRGSGSGILLTADGYAVTNSHVAAGQLHLITKTSDGDRIDAKLVGDDPANDLSLIKLRAKDLPFVTLGDSEGLQAGQLVVAMNDRIIETVDDVHRLLNNLAGSREIELTLIRNGQKTNLMLNFNHS